jgi:hypothetical protein
MGAGRMCWLHDEGQEHVSAVPVGVARTRGDVIPADRFCARMAVGRDELDPDQVVDAAEVNVGWVRS